MKKIFTLIMVAMLAACTLVSCSDKEDKTADTPEKEEVIAENNEQETSEAEDDSTTQEPAKLGKYASVEEYLEANPTFADRVAATAGDSANLVLRAEGNKLIYSISAPAIDDVFLLTGEMDEEDIKVYFDPLIDRMANSMGQAVIEMRKEIPSLESIVIEYTLTDGTPFYSREITEEDATKDYGDTNVNILDMQNMTVEEWAKNLGAQNQTTDYFTLNVEARGNKLAYVYTFNEMIIAQDVDLEYMEASVEELKGPMTDLISMIRSNCPQLESIIYEYVLQDGTVVFSCEFN